MAREIDTILSYVTSIACLAAGTSALVRTESLFVGCYIVWSTITLVVAIAIISNQLIEFHDREHEK